ncbi:hypothetical protein PV08_09914 [Exophiala spinifera]|uniref:G-patch domain-containing protein n=1 Tax=Exophiala spinifera TaxID=91928 RepID=A0A0D1YCI5_9EURO|nr:uncharacterized protein PV08_09914 [Exophiala spinifera]KIW12636.1 hypothetical protein PV08_09914 [Exophiala spinifera]
MDAHAHLLSLGWAGPGHSLDSRPYKQKGHRGLAYDPAKVGNNGTGLVKPLMISQRKGRLGVGKKSHEPQAGNEWWLKGFESALGNVGKSESERSSGASTPVVPLYNGRGKHSGLYSFFIKGQQMEGTIGDDKPVMGTISTVKKDKNSSDDNTTTTTTNKKKRKSDALGTSTDDDDDDDAGDESGQQESSVKKRRKQKQQQKRAAAEFEQVGEYLALRDKDSKRRKRTERPSPVEEFKQVGEYLAARTDKKKKKKDNVGSQQEKEEEDGDQSKTERTETKEKRRERRRKRKEEKERRQKTQPESRGVELDDDVESEDAAAKEARRAERKRRKAAEKAAKAAKGV